MSQRTFQKHDPVTLQVVSRKESRKLPAGTVLIRTAQPLGNLAAFLLEPESIDGPATWNFFDDGLKEGTDFPVVRLPASATLPARRLAPPAGDGKGN